MEKLDPSTTLQRLSKPGQAAKEHREDQSFKQFVAQRTRMLFGSYRKGEAADPEVFVSSVAAVLARYPDDIVRAVTDPFNGLPSEGDWLPTIREVREACERRMAPIYREQKRAQIAQEARRMIEAPRDPEEIRERAVGRWERLRADISGKTKRTTAEEEALAAKQLSELYQTTRKEPLPKISETALRAAGILKDEPEA
jgi:hypothetical protein